MPGRKPKPSLWVVTCTACAFRKVEDSRKWAYYSRDQHQDSHQVWDRKAVEVRVAKQEPDKQEGNVGQDCQA